MIGAQLIPKSGDHRTGEKFIHWRTFESWEKRLHRGLVHGWCVIAIPLYEERAMTGKKQD